MPIRNREKKVINQLVYYVEIPKHKNYLVSNYGKVYKKSTWKEISVLNNCVRLTTNGKQTMLSVVRLVSKLFPADLISYITSNNEVITNTVNTNNITIDSPVSVRRESKLPINQFRTTKRVIVVEDDNDVDVFIPKKRINKEDLYEWVDDGSGELVQRRK